MPVSRDHLFCRDGGFEVGHGYYALGKWHIEYVRPATLEDIHPFKLLTHPMTATPAGNSGSHNSHARLSPSDSKRWAHCTASISATEHIPKDNSVYASEGTEAHDWAEKVLVGTVKLKDVPSDFRPHIKSYVDHCLGLVPEGVTPYIEAKVPLFYDPKSTGTCDFAVVTEDRVWIRDYKHGAGVLVNAVNNEQLAIYALSFIVDLENDGLFDFDPSTIVDIGIVQPRHREGDEVRIWEVTLSDLRDFCRDIEYAAIQIQTGRGLKFDPSEETCRWCPKAWKVKCPARVKALAEAFEIQDIDGMDFLAALPDLSKVDAKKEVQERIEIRTEAAVVEVIEPITSLPEYRELSDAQLAKIFKATKAIKGFLDDVSEVIEERVTRGDNFGGRFKMVMGREGNRAWIDEEAADKFLKNQKLKEDERYDFKLKSPTKAEELLKDKLNSTTRTKNLFDALITRAAAKPVVALADDKRPAIDAPTNALTNLDENLEGLD